MAPLETERIPGTPGGRFVGTTPPSHSKGVTVTPSRAKQWVGTIALACLAAGVGPGCNRGHTPRAGADAAAKRDGRSVRDPASADSAAQRAAAGSAGDPSRGDAATATGEQAGEPGSLFRDWPEPGAVLVFSGQQHGYLEPCGCSPEFQTGGLARKGGFIEEVRGRGWSLMLADLGGLLEDHTKQPDPGKFLIGPQQAQVKLEITLRALQKMGYPVVGLAPEDLFIENGLDGLAGLLINIDNPPEPRELNANLTIPQEFKAPPLALFRGHIVREVGSLRIGLTGVIGERFKDRVAELGWRPPREVLPAVLEKMKGDSDIQVLLLYGYLDEAKELAKAFEDFDLIIHASEYEEPSGRAEWAGSTMLVTVGTKGKYAGAVGIFPEQPRLRFELVSLDQRFEEARDVRKLLDDDYLQALAALHLIEQFPKVPYDRKNPALAFVGVEACKQCHPNACEKWQSTPHANALTTLVTGWGHDKQGVPGKQVNPECVSCHTTGFFYETGYDGTEKTAALGGNGCENCHGPASAHVQIYLNPAASDEEIKRANSLVHLGPQSPERNLCTRCHDAENDPKFEFHGRWVDIEHAAEAADDAALWPEIKEKLKK